MKLSYEYFHCCKNVKYAIETWQIAFKPFDLKNQSRLFEGSLASVLMLKISRF